MFPITMEPLHLKNLNKPNPNVSSHYGTITPEVIKKT
jgi:hypothetical protein